MAQRCSWCNRRTTNVAKRDGLCGSCFRVFTAPPKDPTALFANKRVEQGQIDAWNQKFRDSHTACALGLCAHGPQGKCWFRAQKRERQKLDPSTQELTQE